MCWQRLPSWLAVDDSFYSDLMSSRRLQRTYVDSDFNNCDEQKRRREPGRLFSHSIRQKRKIALDTRLLDRVVVATIDQRLVWPRSSVTSFAVSWDAALPNRPVT